MFYAVNIRGLEHHAVHVVTALCICDSLHKCYALSLLFASLHLATDFDKSGTLMTLQFPLGDFENGPPYAVTSEDYAKLLAPAFELYHGPVVSERTAESRTGRELVALWVRKGE